MHTDSAITVFDRMSEVFSAYRTAWGTGTAAERGVARATVEPRLSRADWLTRLLAPTAGRILRGQGAREVMAAQ